MSSLASLRKNFLSCSVDLLSLLLVHKKTSPYSKKTQRFATHLTSSLAVSPTHLSRNTRFSGEIANTTSRNSEVLCPPMNHLLSKLPQPKTFTLALSVFSFYFGAYRVSNSCQIKSVPIFFNFPNLNPFALSMIKIRG